MSNEIPNIMSEPKQIIFDSALRLIDTETKTCIILLTVLFIMSVILVILLLQMRKTSIYNHEHPENNTFRNGILAQLYALTDLYGNFSVECDAINYIKELRFSEPVEVNLSKKRKLQLKAISIRGDRDLSVVPLKNGQKMFIFDNMQLDIEPTENGGHWCPDTAAYKTFELKAILDAVCGLELEELESQKDHKLRLERMMEVETGDFIHGFNSVNEMNLNPDRMYVLSLIGERIRAGRSRNKSFILAEEVGTILSLPPSETELLKHLLNTWYERHLPTAALIYFCELFLFGLTITEAYERTTQQYSLYCPELKNK